MFLGGMRNHGYIFKAPVNSMPLMLLTNFVIDVYLKPLRKPKPTNPPPTAACTTQNITYTLLFCLMHGEHGRQKRSYWPQPRHFQEDHPGHLYQEDPLKISDRREGVTQLHGEKTINRRHAGIKRSTHRFSSFSRFAWKSNFTRKTLHNTRRVMSSFCNCDKHVEPWHMYS